MSAAARARTAHTASGLNRYLWALLLVTNIVDVLASRRAFQFDIAEMNPLLGTVLAAFGLPGLALVKAFWLVVLLLLLSHIRGWTQVLFSAACLTYVALTAVHIWHLSPLL